MKKGESIAIVGVDSQSCCVIPLLVWIALSFIPLSSLLKDPFSGVSAEYQKHLEEEQKKLLQGFITVGNINTWLLEMHEFLLLNLGKPHVSGTYKPDWR